MIQYNVFYSISLYYAGSLSGYDYKPSNLLNEHGFIDAWLCMYVVQCYIDGYK
jgi:hypothetical protein